MYIVTAAYPDWPMYYYRGKDAPASWSQTKTSAKRYHHKSAAQRVVDHVVVGDLRKHITIHVERV